VEGSCEHGNEPLGSIKCWEILEQLSDWKLLKKGLSSMELVHEVCKSIYKDNSILVEYMRHSSQ
jgi:hypothetical protein